MDVKYEDTPHEELQHLAAERERLAFLLTNLVLHLVEADRKMQVSIQLD